MSSIRSLMRTRFHFGCFGAWVTALWVASTGVVWSADPGAEAAAIAERQELRESMRSLSAKVEDLWTAHAAQQKRISAVGDEVSKFRMEHDRGNTKFATKEDLQKLSDSLRQAVRELDEKREADRKLILEELRKLAKMPVPAPAPAIPAPEPKPRGESAKSNSGGDGSVGASATREGYEYEVRKDDTLSSILQAYNDEFKKQGKKTVSLKQVMDLDENKHLKPNALRVGQKLFIPDPPKK